MAAMTNLASALLVVLGSLALLRIALQWAGVGSSKGPRRGLRVVETCALGSKKRLHVVEVDGERLLIGASESGLSTLQTLRPVPEDEVEEAEVDTAPAPTPSLGRRWVQVMGLLAPALALLLGAVPGWAESGLTIRLDGLDEPEQLNSTLEMVAFFTIVGIAPSILLMATSFTRIVIVLAFLRQAIGVQHLPPNQVLVGLALFTTMFVMAPLGDQIRVQAYEPYVAQEIDASEAAELALAPVRTFLLGATRESDLTLFLEISGTGPVDDLSELPMTTILPSYMLSELRTAFEIGFMVYLPFLVIDLVIASMLISMGMIVLPPIMPIEINIEAITRSITRKGR